MHELVEGSIERRILSNSRLARSRGIYVRRVSEDIFFKHELARLGIAHERAARVVALAVLDVVSEISIARGQGGRQAALECIDEIFRRYRLAVCPARIL